MWTEVHNWFRRVGAVATTAWFVTFLAAGGNAYGQTRHHHGRHHGAPTAPAVLAQSQPRGPASSPTPAEISAEECPDRDGSGATAGQARTASRARDYVSAETLWSTAIVQCGLPDRYQGRAIARESRQGTLSDGPERLALIDSAIADYNQALMRANLVDGFQTRPIQAALTALQEFRTQLVARMQAPTVVATHVTAPPSALMCPARQLACGGACVELASDVRNCGGCGNVCPAGNVCTAGRCNAILANNHPAVVDHSGRRRAGWVLVGIGAVGAAVGAALHGLAAYNDGLDQEQRAALAQRGCRETSAIDCVQPREGATSPATVADTERTAAWATIAGGGAAAIVGAIIVGISPNAPQRTTAFFNPADGTVGVSGQF